MKRPIPWLASMLAAMSAIGPFSIDTYLPAFHTIAASLSASQLEVQQTLTAYMLTFALMVLWHGALADAYGRRRVIIAANLLFALASLVCALAPNIETLWAGRVLQGMSAGAGMVVGRAVVRDVYEGPDAQRLLSQVMMIFAIAPAVAPIIGGQILAHLGWRAIFVFLAAWSTALALLCWRRLPETLPAARRVPLHPGSLLRNYRSVLGHPAFLLLSAAMALNFNGFFVYVLSAPVFVLEHLKLSPESFGWLFIPSVSGMMFGSWLSGRAASRWSALRTIGTGYLLMVGAATFNLIYSGYWPASLPWSVLPVGLYNIGMALAMPSLTLLALDLFPAHRGVAASCQSLCQVGTNSLSAAAIAPLLWRSPFGISLGMAGFMAIGLGAFVWWRQRHGR